MKNKFHYVKRQSLLPFFSPFGTKFFILRMLRSLALRPPAVSHSAPHFRFLFFPFSSVPFFFSSSFSFLNINLEWGKPFCFQSSFQVIFSFSCGRPVLFFSFGCSSAKSLYLCGFLWFLQWQQSAGATVSFLDFLGFFSFSLFRQG